MAVFDNTHRTTTWVITTLIANPGRTYYMARASDSNRFSCEWVLDLSRATKYPTKAQLYAALKELISRNTAKTDYQYGVEQVETSVRTLHETSPYNYSKDVDIHTDLLEAAVRKAKAVLTPAEYELLGIANREAYVKLATHGVASDD